MNAPMTKFAIMRANREKQEAKRSLAQLASRFRSGQLGGSLQVIPKETRCFGQERGPDRFFTWVESP